LFECIGHFPTTSDLKNLNPFTAEIPLVPKKFPSGLYVTILDGPRFEALPTLSGASFLIGSPRFHLRAF
jgi:hypothetical protein